MCKASRREVHLLQVRVQLAGSEQSHFQFGRFSEGAPRQPESRDRQSGETSDNQAQPQILGTRTPKVFSRKPDGESMQATSFQQGLELLVSHPGWSPPTRPVRGIHGCEIRNARSKNIGIA